MTANEHAPAKQATQAIKKAKSNRDQARKKLLRQRERLAERRKQNKSKSEQNRAQDPSSETTQNPSAHSTVPPQKTNGQNAARNSHSTVPRVPKYSDVDAQQRLYGLRLATHQSGADTDNGE